MYEKQPSLAQVFILEELPGRTRKYLEVPPGKLGIALNKNGEVETYVPGRHLVASGVGRLFGGKAGFRAGLIPAGPFNTRIKAENLLSGDKDVMDASLLCEVEVVDPALFFTQQVLPRGGITGHTLDLSDKTSWELLGGLTPQYAAADLVRGAPTQRILPQLRAGLPPLLQSQGLGLIQVQLLTFVRMEDQALAAEKALVLQDRLRDLKLQEKMAAVETEVQFADFIRQLEPEFGEKVGLYPIIEGVGKEDLPETETPAEGAPSSLLDTIRTWINFESRKDETGKHWRIESLFQRAGDKEKAPPPKRSLRPQRWWLPRTLWMGFVLLAAIVITRLVNWISGGEGWGARLEFYLGLWGFAVVVVFESLYTLFKKREEIQDIHWAEPGTTFVDNLVGHDRARADALVRRQCEKDLLNALGMLNDLRSRVYKSGAEERALKIKTLEKKIERTRGEVMNPNIGVPPYVTDLKISRWMWNDLLDYDELLLIRSSAFSDDVQAIQQRYAEEDISPAELSQLEGRLDAFGHHFRNRSQALKASEEEKVQYRL